MTGEGDVLGSLVQSKNSQALGEREAHGVVKSVPALSNMELIMLAYPRSRREAVFLLGTYMELVDKEAVIKRKELLVGTVKGVLKAKVGQIASRAAPEIIFAEGWSGMLQ